MCDVEDDSEEEGRWKNELGRSAGFENKVVGIVELWVGNNLGLNL